MTKTYTSATASLLLVLVSALAYADSVSDAYLSSLPVIAADMTDPWADLATVVDLSDALAALEADEEPCLTAALPACWLSPAWVGLAWSSHYIAHDTQTTVFNQISAFNER